MSVELSQVNEYLKTQKVLINLKVTATPNVMKTLRRSWKKSWNLKRSKEFELCQTKVKMKVLMKFVYQPNT